MKKSLSPIAHATASLILCLCVFTAWAQADPAAEMKAALTAAQAVAKDGPADVKLSEQAAIHLPEGFAFIPKNEAARILRAMGNRPGPDLLGMIFGKGADDNWFVVANYVKSGYIKDDDAKDWKADELLSNIKAGTEETNKERKSRGIPEVEVVGWIERPAYDPATHRLVWSMSSRDKNAPVDSPQGVNYNTYLLGREGFISMNLVTDLAAIEKLKPTARSLLAATEFDKGKTYADFNSATDHVAEFGLAALIGGVAAKKLGLFALIAAFAVKFAKVIGLAVIGFGALAMKMFKKKKPEDTA